MTSKVAYLGDLRTECTHIQSGNSFITDAPLDNNGKGLAFSPTDTVATGLASCMMTVMGIKARDMDIDMTGTSAAVTKSMSSQPRRISKIEIVMTLPFEADQKTKSILENTGNSCPVFNSLHPDIEIVVDYQWS